MTKVNEPAEFSAWVTEHQPCIHAKKMRSDLAGLHHLIEETALGHDLSSCFIVVIPHAHLWHITCSVVSVPIIATIMKIAIPLFRQRIAPLFESAETFILISLDDPDSESTILETRRLRIDEKCHQLFSDGTRVLLCGALSRQWHVYLRQQGIEVHAFLAGDAKEVLRTYRQDGERGLGQYAMPGCKGNHRGGRKRRLGRRHTGEFCQFQ